MSVYLQLVVIYDGKSNSLQVLVMKISRFAVLFKEEPPHDSQRKSLNVIDTTYLDEINLKSVVFLSIL